MIDIKSTFPRPIVALCGLVLMTACAAFPPPTDSVANAHASVRGAEELGAADVPQAALQLQLAREQVVKAEALLADGENESAHYLALRATNDADLAIALVREDEARVVAKTAKQRVETAEAEVAQ